MGLIYGDTEPFEMVNRARDAPDIKSKAAGHILVYVWRCGGANLHALL
jgi:hypothetical protein